METRCVRIKLKDAYHKQFKKECWESVTLLEQLIDLDLL